MSKTREKLIDAAITYLNTEGKEKISVKKLIKIADVGYGTFYNHFDSVEAIQYEALNKTVRNTLIDFKLGVKNEKDYDLIKEDDVFNFIDLSEFSPGKNLNIEVVHSDGTLDTIEANHTYNQQQIEWFKEGSALNLIKKENASQ